jgi:hypothetical protein
MELRLHKKDNDTIIFRNKDKPSGIFMFMVLFIYLTCLLSNKL